MKLWVLSRLPEGPEEVSDFFIRERTEKDAREWAARLAGAEGPEVWLDKTKVTCEQVGIYGATGIIIRAVSGG